MHRLKKLHRQPLPLSSSTLITRMIVHQIISHWL
ncbi:hypothetical protein [Acinetobacter sp.]